MDSLANEILRGAGKIAQYLHGRDNAKNRRAVYRAHEKGHIPTWKEGDVIITTKTALRAHYACPPPKIQAAE
jgi:hypothetical protein